MNDTVAVRQGPTQRADYLRFLPLTLRLLDNDLFGHVNNAHYYSLFDTTICEYLVATGILGRPDAAFRVVMAESGCRYHSEISFPQPIEGAVRVARLGQRSVRYQVGVFRAGAEVASADGFMVHVCVSRRTGRPAAMPDEWRAHFEALMVGE